jgi:hypothetical protein
MSLSGAAYVFAILFLGVIYVLVAPKVWRGESGLDGDRPPVWWFLGKATWRGVARAYLATVPFVLLLFAGGAIAAFTDAGLAIAAAALVLGLVVNLGIVLFNRPQALVPPHLRGERGALAGR